jgi:hypothetical protein
VQTQLWLPGNHVKKAEEAPLEPTRSAVSEADSPPPPSLDRAIVLYTYAPEVQHQHTISMTAGDVIEVTVKGDPSGWWRGYVEGTSVEGDFPAHHRFYRRHPLAPGTPRFEQGTCIPRYKSKPGKLQ